MRIVIHALFIVLILYYANVHAQVYNDATIEYDILLTGKLDPATTQIFNNAHMVLYIRGQQSRSEVLTNMGKTITIFDEKNGNVVLLNEYGNQRVMVRLSADQYTLINKKYMDAPVELLGQNKSVNGYECKSAKIKVGNGSDFLVYYAPQLKFQTLYNGFPKILAGFPMEYESEIEGLKVLYRVRKIKLDAVSANLFDIPEEGYRVMKFEEVYKP